ncbi:MAG: hypothetical protein IJP93_12565, partial [Bacteroidales bacterium]|nr:hypothetical protein [Bacteroidales bacterium]
ARRCHHLLAGAFAPMSLTDIDLHHIGASAGRNTKKPKMSLFGTGLRECGDFSENGYICILKPQGDKQLNLYLYENKY